MAIYTITLGFVPSRIWERSIQAHQKTKSPNLQHRHIFLDQHYPLDKQNNQNNLRRINEEFHVEHWDAKSNLGLHKGFNHVLNQLKLKDEDIVIGYDPDSNPITPGWDMALLTALWGDQNTVWSTLMSQRAKEDILSKSYKEKMIRHLKVWQVNQAVINSVCAWKGSFLKGSQGLHQPMEFYGHLESAMWLKLKSQKKEWCFVTGWWEDHSFWPLHDEKYIWWKWRHAHLHDWPGDFESYVNAGCPEPSDLKKIPSGP